MLDGRFNDVWAWNVSQVPGLINEGVGHLVATEESFVSALQESLAATDTLSVIHVKLANDDFSPALRRLTSNLGKRV